MLFTLKPEISFQLYELVRHSRYNASLLQRELIKLITEMFILRIVHDCYIYTLWV